VPAFNDAVEQFAGLDAQVLGVSIDSIPSHIAWQRREIGMMNFPLLSDLYPHGEVARKFGIFREGPPVPGINERAVFIVDKNGRIAFSKVYPLDQVPSVPECLEVVRKLNQAAAGR
jgi:alkyl hydroperoxide reductase subunit AhpC